MLFNLKQYHLHILMANKLTTILDPLDSYIEYFKESKPYHTKILEIVETYEFEECICVHMEEDVLKHIGIENDPLCEETGFGLVFDDECGYDAIDCCSLFDCYGGYGFIFDNSDLVFEHAITLVGNDDDTSQDGAYLELEGNHTTDLRIPIAR